MPRAKWIRIFHESQLKQTFSPLIVMGKKHILISKRTKRDVHVVFCVFWYSGLILDSIFICTSRTQYWGKSVEHTKKTINIINPTLETNRHGNLVYTLKLEKHKHNHQIHSSKVLVSWMSSRTSDQGNDDSWAILHLLCTLIADSLQLPLSFNLLYCQ